MLTEKQQHFFDYLKRRLQDEGQLPSLRQAARELEISHNAVAQLLAQLEKKGMVAREGRYSRTLRLLPKDSRPERALGRELPIIGRVTAGMPMYAQQEWAGSVVVDDKMFGGEPPDRSHDARPGRRGRELWRRLVAHAVADVDSILHKLLPISGI